MSKELSYSEWVEEYFRSGRNNHERFGQAFMNDYMRNKNWPELFYEKDDRKAQQIIFQFLQDNCYNGTLPQSYR